VTVEANPDIVLVWPKDRPPPVPSAIDGYRLRMASGSRDHDAWIEIHQRAVPTFGEPDLRGWLDRYQMLALPDGILLAEDEETGEAVSTAGALAHDAGGRFPGGGQVGWVATVPEHRGKGLATWLSSIVTARLIGEGFPHVVVVTGDDLLAAIRVYRGIGYLPYLYAPDQPERWRRICELAGLVYAPADWPTDPQAFPRRARPT
jgi:GNAT superfamily N-acetyltransferase